jgi:uncharacterized protein
MSVEFSTRVEPAPIPSSASQFMVPMRDGVHLATDVYLPESGEPTQTVLVRLCYDKDGRYTFMPLLAPRITGRGYAFVVQDVRGKFRSGGTTLAYVHEARDGYDTLDWIVRQPWSDGKVGMFGDSYYGFTQWAAVSSGHPALRAIVPRVTSAHLGMIRLGQDRHRRGAVEDVEDVEWLVSANYLSHYWLDNLIHDYEIDYSVRPLIRAFDQAFERLGKRSASFDLGIPHRLPVPIYPDGHPFDARPIPVLHAVGWFDNLAIQHMRDYVELQHRPGWSLTQYLIADSSDHENYHLSLVPIDETTDHDTNDEALERMLTIYLDPALEFFDVFLKEKRSADSLPRVRWHLGHVGYRESSVWPPAGAEEHRLYLTSLADAAGTGATAGRLFEKPFAEPERVEWTYDPSDPVPSVVKNSFAFLREYPDEAGLGSRPDVLVFDGDALEEPLDLTGPVDLFVRVASDSPTTDVFARLLDVTSDGAAHLILRGQSHLLAPSETTLVNIELGHTGYRVGAGHHLRLHLTSSDFPEYMLHPGTGDDPWLTTETRLSRQTLCSDPTAPVYLALTVSPALEEPR